MFKRHNLFKAFSALAVVLLVLAALPTTSANADVTGTISNYDILPNIDEVIPNAGPLIGGQMVAITGTQFSDTDYAVTSVSFDGTAYTLDGSTPTINGHCHQSSATQITCLTLEHVAGLVDVVVSTDVGSMTKTDAYLYVSVPTISTFSLDIGPTNGTSPVVIVGTNLAVTSGPIQWTGEVKFGGTLAECHADSNIQLSCITPGHVKGQALVTVKTPGETATAGRPFLYVVPQTLGVFPNFGTIAGGTPITILGYGFNGTTGFSIGGANAACSVASDTKINCVTPSHSAGLVGITLTGGDGGDRIYPEAFTFIPAASTILTPSYGPTAGGTKVTITGINFTNAKKVLFDDTPADIPADSFVVANSTKIYAFTPTFSARTTAVLVKGLSDVDLIAAGTTFTFIPPESNTDISPNYGPTSGGTVVTIHGVGLAEAKNVTFAGVKATDFKVRSDYEITFKTPAHSAGFVDVVVNSPTKSTTYSNGYAYTESDLPTVKLSYPNGFGDYISRWDAANYIQITYGQPMNENGPGGPNWETSVLNPANYIMVGVGPNNELDTRSCLEGPSSKDVLVKINSITSFNPSLHSYVFWVNDGFPLKPEDYNLFACGTTSITNPAGLKLNAGIRDSVFHFKVLDPEPSVMPVTGFAPNRVTSLPIQTTNYDELGDVWIEIPRLGIAAPIVGVPQDGIGSWDVSWLGDRIGLLDGTAFPSFSGNSVLTGHVYTDKGVPGPFARLSAIWEGENIIVHVYGTSFVYIVREKLEVGPDDVGAMINHKDSPWLTLMTCRSWNESTEAYNFHFLARAELLTSWVDK